MDMRRLIDETDFDNLNELSRRWKKEKDQNHTALEDSHCAQSASPVTVSQVPSNLHLSNPERHAVKEPPSSRESYAEVSLAKKRNPMPQVIDEDTQHFKNRLQHLLSTFKTDAISEFMTMKRDMLDYQKECVKSDTQKYLTLYEEKHQELVSTKDKLIEVTRECQRRTIQVELMSNYIAKLNERVKITRYLSRPFALLYENKEREKMIKFKMAQAAKSDTRRLKLKSLTGWKNLLRVVKQEREKEQNDKRVEMEVAEIVGRFQKQIEVLKERLAESTRKNEQYDNNRHMMQQNLKKAFLRGISAMNMQAMGIFGSEPQSDKQDFAEEAMQHNYSHYVEPNPMTMSRSAVKPSLNQTTLNAVQTNSNNSFIVTQPKLESKDHKWKQAPILGVQEKVECEEPRPTQFVKPVTEGKVIKIVDGRSSLADVKKTGASQSIKTEGIQGGSKKRI